MRMREVVSSNVVAPQGYSAGVVALLLTVGQSTLASHVAMGTLVSGATPTLRTA